MKLRTCVLVNDLYVRPRASQLEFNLEIVDKSAPRNETYNLCNKLNKIIFNSLKSEEEKSYSRECKL